MTDTELWSIKEVANAFKKHGIIQDQEPSGDLISKQAVIDAIKHAQFNFQIISTINFADYKKEVQEIVDNILSAQIKAINDLPSVNPQEPKTGHCKDCKYFEYDSVAKVDGIPLIVAHEICSRWGDGCKTKEDGYCFLFEPQERNGEE